MNIANDTNFQKRVKYALQSAALGVMAEAGNVTSHAARVIYAKLVLSGSANVFEVSVGVLNNSTIASEAEITVPASGSFSIPDSDIQFAVNSDFNAFAGVAN